MQDSPPAADRFSDIFPLRRGAIPSGGLFVISEIQRNFLSARPPQAAQVLILSCCLSFLPSGTLNSYKIFTKLPVTYLLSRQNRYNIPGYKIVSGFAGYSACGGLPPAASSSPTHGDPPGGVFSYRTLFPIRENSIRLRRRTIMPGGLLLYNRLR